MPSYFFQYTGYDQNFYNHLKLEVITWKIKSYYRLKKLQIYLA